MKFYQNALLAILFLGIFSCNNHQDQTSEIPNPNMEKTQDNTDTKDNKTGEIIDRKIIKEGFIQFQTSNLEKTKSSIVTAVNQLKGYISKENVSTYSDNVEHQLVIRIPAEKFDELLKIISASAQIESQTVEVKDVTEEYIDVDARINTKKELQAKYNELLKQTNRVDEILNIQKEIADLQEDLESVEGRMKYLNDQIKYSTLTVTYYEKSATSFGFIQKIVPAVKDGWNGLLGFIILLFRLWAFLIIIGLIVFFVVRNKKRKRDSLPKI